MFSKVSGFVIGKKSVGMRNIVAFIIAVILIVNLFWVLWLIIGSRNKTNSEDTLQQTEEVPYSLQSDEEYESLVSSYKGEEPEWFECESFADIPQNPGISKTEIVEKNAKNTGELRISTSITKLWLNDEEEGAAEINSALRELYEAAEAEMEVYNQEILDEYLFEDGVLQEDLDEWLLYPLEEWLAISEESYVAAIEYVDENYLCLSMNGYNYVAAGAHGYYWSNYYVFDRHTGQRLSLEDFVDNNPEDIKEIVKNHIVAAAPYSKGEQSENALEQNRFFLTAEGLGIHYDVYEIGDYASGPLDLVIPFALFDMKEDISMPSKQEKSESGQLKYQVYIQPDMPEPFIEVLRQYEEFMNADNQNLNDEDVQKKINSVDGDWRYLYDESWLSALWRGEEGVIGEEDVIRYSLKDLTGDGYPELVMGYYLSDDTILPEVVYYYSQTEGIKMECLSSYYTMVLYGDGVIKYISGGVTYTETFIQFQEETESWQQAARVVVDWDYETDSVRGYYWGDDLSGHLTDNRPMSVEEYQKIIAQYAAEPVELEWTPLILSSER